MKFSQTKLHNLVKKQILLVQCLNKKSIYALLMSGYSSVPQNEKTEMNIDTRDKKDLDSRVGLIKALLDEDDPTLGAEFWDGTDFLAWGDGVKVYNRNSHAKFRQYGSIHITKEIYNNYLNNTLLRYPSGKIKYSSNIYYLPHPVFTDSKYWLNNIFMYKTNAINRKNGKAISEKLIATISVGNTIFWSVKL